MTMVADGFTAQEDRVAYLFYKNGRTSKLELRHVYGIQNPAEAINASEAKYHYTVETGATLPNGDVPYRLVEGSIPAIAGTLPMFTAEQIEDADSGPYVAALDLYVCRECGRHPVYLPSGGKDGPLTSICPRHGPRLFSRVP